MTPGLASHNAFKIILGNAFSPHVFPVLFGWLRNRPTDEISDRKRNVKVFVGIFMMQEVMASAELVDPPVRKKPASRLMHFQMDLIPDRMVQSYDKHKHSGTHGENQNSMIAIGRPSTSPSQKFNRIPRSSPLGMGSSWNTFRY